MNRNSRPRWARNLTAAQWRHLCETQNTSRPTLANLRADVELQRNLRDSQGLATMRCWDCEQSLARAEGR